MTILNQIGDPHAWHEAVSDLMHDPESLYKELKSLVSHNGAQVVESFQNAIDACIFLNTPPPGINFANNSFMDHHDQFQKFIATVKLGMKWLDLSLKADNATIKALKQRIMSSNYENDDLATWAAIRLLGNTRRSTPIKIPFGVVNKEGKGVLCWLELQVLDDGLNRTIPHTIDYLQLSLNGTVPVRSDFKQAIESAWSIANNHVKISAPNTVKEGYWRVIVDGEEWSNQAINGGSAGGAAIYGWYHVLKKTQPDQGLIVLAKAPSEIGSNLLGGVDGVEAKTEAIGRNNNFDTIVVADNANYAQAVEGLGNAHFTVCGIFSENAPVTYLSQDDRVIRVINLVHWSAPIEEPESPTPP